MPDTPYMIDATIRVPIGLWRQFHAACLAHDTVPSAVLREAMEDALVAWELADQQRATSLGRHALEAWAQRQGLLPPPSTA